MRRTSRTGSVRVHGGRLRALAPLVLLMFLAMALARATPAEAAKGPALCDGFVVTIAGTSGRDVLSGTAGRDVIAAGQGNDLVDGRGGDDVICGDNGDDVLAGGEGNDVVIGENGVDDLFGDAGNDRLVGGNGVDRLSGDSGNDTISGDNGGDELEGGTGLDTLDGGNGPDRCANGETYVGCENIAATPDPLAALGAAPPGLRARSFARGRQSGDRLERRHPPVGSPGQRRPGGDADRARRACLAGLRLHAPARHSRLPARRITIRTTRVGSAHSGRRASDQDTRRDHRPLARRRDDQVVDTVNDTVTVTVSHFSVYAVLKLDDQSWALRASTLLHSDRRPRRARRARRRLRLRARRVREHDVERSAGLRKTAAKQVVDRLAEVSDLDRVGVVSFNSSARTRSAHVARGLLERGRGQGGIDAVSPPAARHRRWRILGIDELTRGAPAAPARVMILMTDGIGSYSDTITAARRQRGS